MNNRIQQAINIIGTQELDLSNLCLTTEDLQFLLNIKKYKSFFESLEVLNLNNNKIITLPIEIGDLVNLEKLFLNDNPIKEIPQELKNKEGLKIFY